MDPSLCLNIRLIFKNLIKYKFFGEGKKIVGSVHKNNFWIIKKLVKYLKRLRNLKALLIFNINIKVVSNTVLLE